MKFRLLYDDKEKKPAVEETLIDRPKAPKFILYGGKVFKFDHIAGIGMLRELEYRYREIPESDVLELECPGYIEGFEIGGGT